MKRIRTRRPRRVRRVGFTLMEVLLVLAILGVIAAMVVPQLIGRQQKAMVDRAQLDVKSIEKACEMYTTDHNGQFIQSDSASQQALLPMTQPETLQTTGVVLRPYLSASNLKDPWGNLYFYQYPHPSFPNGEKPGIWSAGPDMQSGTNDDIVNWDKTQTGGI